MKYLIRAHGKKNSAHLWTGSDTLCRLWSTGGINQDKKWDVHDEPGDHPICTLCKKRADIPDTPSAPKKAAGSVKSALKGIEVADYSTLELCIETFLNKLKEAIEAGVYPHFLEGDSNEHEATLATWERIKQRNPKPEASKFLRDLVNRKQGAVNWLAKEIVALIPKDKEQLDRELAEKIKLFTEALEVKDPPRGTLIHNLQHGLPSEDESMTKEEYISFLAEDEYPCDSIDHAQIRKELDELKSGITPKPTWRDADTQAGDLYTVGKDDGFDFMEKNPSTTREALTVYLSRGREHWLMPDDMFDKAVQSIVDRVFHVMRLD